LPTPPPSVPLLSAATEGLRNLG